MRRAFGLVPFLFCMLIGAALAAGDAGDAAAGNAGETDTPAKAEGQAAPEQPGLAELVDAMKADLADLDALRANMEVTLEAIENVDREVGELRRGRLEQRLSEIADLSPEMEQAIEKLRLLHERSEKLRNDLQKARQAQKELFDSLELEREEKDILRGLLSEREMPMIPAERREVRPRRDGDRRDGDDRARSDWGQRLREHNERLREERQRRLDEIKQQDPELHALLVRKVELLDKLDEPRVEVAEHLQSVQRVLRELHRRLGEMQRLLEAGREF